MRVGTERESVFAFFKNVTAVGGFNAEIIVRSHIGNGERKFYVFVLALFQYFLCFAERKKIYRSLFDFSVCFIGGRVIKFYYVLTRCFAYVGYSDEYFYDVVFVYRRAIADNLVGFDVCYFPFEFRIGKTVSERILNHVFVSVCNSPFCFGVITVPETFRVGGFIPFISDVNAFAVVLISNARIGNV